MLYMVLGFTGRGKSSRECCLFPYQVEETDFGAEISRIEYQHGERIWEVPGTTHMGWMRRTSYMHPRWRQTVSTSCPVHIYLFYFFKTSKEKSKHDNTLEEPRCWLPTWYWYLHLVSDDYWECLVDFQVCIYSSLRSIVWATCSQRLSSNF